MAPFGPNVGTPMLTAMSFHIRAYSVLPQVLYDVSTYSGRRWSLRSTSCSPCIHTVSLSRVFLCVQYMQLLLCLEAFNAVIALL